ncbi:carbon-nitrogen hydrolase family protein [Thalassotalea sp. HSM 43]|uniref:carbon-nitrogen hydrolase family protein n=1 Tax=Thalassotalea sp. HSM 43 TaxID=2552945 RepID=UPI001081D13E|nr:carbon-nitrogen hydrolase family protein [Thalassotalea sp. HSM 43]QBY04542.1 carbon-nitrogen hydrolase family protein [Thalassotalea sp. HSM 43]
MRVAALQFASTLDVEDNLQTCLQMIDKAAVCQPDLMVLPEFCNALSWYQDQAHAWQLALDIDGEFLQSIAKKAAQYNSFIVINVSLRRQHPDITVTSVMFDKNGQILATADKQTLMGHENTFFKRADQLSPIVVSEYGNLAMFPCRDGVTCETPRGLAIRGAQLFCDSLNSFALDEAALHVPARAVENGVYLVAANKTGALIPEQILEEVAHATNIPKQYLYGAGESQIVAPDGRVLAKAPYNEPGFIYADVDLHSARSMQRADKSQVFNNRRPELYQDIAKPALAEYCQGGDKQVSVGLLQVDDKTIDPLLGISQLKRRIRDLNEQLIVLPELCFLKQAYAAGANDLATAGKLSDVLVREIAASLKPEQYLVTSIVHFKQHKAVLIDDSGIRFSQRQLHHCNRLAWSELADELKICRLPWGNVALLTGDDVCYPELAKVAALKGAHAIVCPIDIQQAWEADYGLLSRSAENRINVIACSRDNQLQSQTSRHTVAGLIAALPYDFTLMSTWQKRQFDGHINYPIVTRQNSELTSGFIYPNAATNKLMSADTDLLSQRPWQLSDTLMKKAESLPKVKEASLCEQ